MPKERITDKSVDDGPRPAVEIDHNGLQGDLNTPRTIPASSYETHVQWIRDGRNVQIGTVDDQSSESGVFVDLNRARVNGLIRILRKARDQAFGADE